MWTLIKSGSVVVASRLELALGLRLVLGIPCAGGTTAYCCTFSGWPMEEALCEVTLKGCAE